MQVLRDRTSEFYIVDNRRLGNCFTVTDGKNKAHYEFEIHKNEAKIRYDSILYIKEAIREFRKYNRNVNIFYNESRSFYQGFDEVYTFLLPIDILQPTQYFLDEEKMNAVTEYLSNSEISVPVAVIDEEYVLLDGHARVRYFYEEGKKMIPVYLEEPDPLIQEYVYIAKENNIFKVKTMEILSHPEYEQYLKETEREN